MKILLCLCIFFSASPGANAIGTYTVLAPNILRPNRDFTVVVSDHGGRESTRISVQIEETRERNFVSRDVVELRPNTTETFKFEVGGLQEGDYSLTVTGFGEHNFADTTPLRYESKSYSVFIQTDQAVYRPSDVIKFRVVVVNPLLKPSVTGAIDVFIKDGDGNTVKQFLRVFTNKGVFSDQIQLSDEPVLGNWQIFVDVLNQRTIATVMVAQYVLPKFEVEVELPTYITFSDEQIAATITARYSHGRPVKGEVTLQVSPTFKYGYLQTPFDQPISVVKQIKGKTSISLNIFDDLHLREDATRELRFTAYVKEELTNRVQNSTSTITLFRYPYKMQLVRPSDSFKPGLKYNAILKLSYQDDTPVQEGKVAVRHAFSKNSIDFTEVMHDVPRNGIVPLEFYPPLDESISNLAIGAKFGNLSLWLADLSKAQSPSNTFLQASLLSESPKVGDEVQVGLNSTEPMVSFVFEIIGRGDIIFAQTLQTRNQKEHSFRFIASVAMSPMARLVVYYVRPDGEVVADSLHFAVDGAIQNAVTVNVNPSTIDAGKDVSITVITKPNAFVAITAIDQNSLMLADGNHITENVILNELDSYDPGVKNSLRPSPFLDQRNEVAHPNLRRTGTATEVFENSGVIFMSNGNIPDSTLQGGGGRFDGLVLTSRGPVINNSSSTQVKTDLGHGIVHISPTRPPLAGPYAFSYLPSPPDDKPRIYLNKAVPGSWLFQDTRTRLNGIITIRERVPPSITSYIISAFAIDDFFGLGVAPLSNKLTVFRPFFVSVHAPSPVVRGESIAVEVVVFNYGTKPVTANVTIFNSGDFLFPEFGNEIHLGSPSPSRSRMVEVMAESDMTLSFMIVPQILGPINIRISAASANAFDSVRKQVIVKPEGETLKRNIAMLVDLTTNSPFSEDVNITTPNNIVKDSLKISVSIIGDILGPAVENSNNLIQLPSGCGEQNLAKLMPNVLLLNYLEKKGPVSEEMKNKIVQNIELGFQKQLSFRHMDGSFSIFGPKDQEGSTWLTAFVVRSFPMLQNYIYVDPDLIFNATLWLMENQDLDGSFKEKGVINNVALQGGTGNDIPLTAYVIIALSNIQKNIAGGSLEGLGNSINRGLEYLSSHFDVTEDSYSLAMCSYAFQIAEHPFRDSVFFKLEAKALIDGDKKWWSDTSLQETIETVVDSKSIDVETTAYALLTYSARGAVTDSLPLISWLTAQRNEKGGFHSSQDTILGIMALTSISSFMQNSNPRIEIQIIYGERGDIALVRPDNFKTLQRREISNDTENLTIKARGSGYAIVQVTYEYNVIVTGPDPSFSLDPQLDRTTDKNMLRLTSCTGYTGGNTSNMAILDVSLPTGYVIDNDLLYSLYDYENIKRVEEKKDGRGILLYFDNLARREVCPTITAYRVSKVAFQQKVPVKVYDYYDLSRQARQFYTPFAATLCDICDLSECDERQCENQIVQLNKQLQDPSDFLYPVDIEDRSTINVSNYFLIFFINLTILVNFLLYV